MKKSTGVPENEDPNHKQTGDFKLRSFNIDLLMLFCTISNGYKTTEKSKGLTNVLK